MNYSIRFILWLGLCGWGAELIFSDEIVTFDELSSWTSTTATGSYFNGDSGIGTNSIGWSSNGVTFGNSFNAQFGGFWSGFGYSNVRDVTTAGFTNQYAAYHLPDGNDVTGDGNYGVAYAGSQTFFSFQVPSRVDSIYLTNTTYAALAMRDGDAFSKKFGGVTGDDPDFFALIFTGYEGLNGEGSVTGEQRIYLADYRFEDNSLDYILNQWTRFELSSLGIVQSVRLGFDSSDVGPFGISTPVYVALDNLRFSPIPEPSPGLLLLSLAAASWMRRRGRQLPGGYLAG